MATTKRKRSPFSDDPDEGDDVPTLFKRFRASTGALGALSSVNGNKGFTKLPEELNREIIRHYSTIGDTTHIPEGAYRRAKASKGQRGAAHSTHRGGARCLPLSYLDRSDTLRTLCATCKAYRDIFLPILWESVDICFASRRMNCGEDGGGFEPAGSEPVHRTIGEATLRKSRGLIENPDLAVLVRSVSVIFTRHNMDVVLRTFAQCLQLMPNLRTLRVLDANPQMPNAIRTAFNDDTVLPGVRTLIIPAVCHELLKRCPNVETVWCNQGTGNKLITVIGTYCKKVVEVKGLRCEEDPNAIKRLVKGLPKLEVLEMNAPLPKDTAILLAGLKHVRRVDIRIPRRARGQEDRAVQRTIDEVKAVLHAQPKAEEIRLRLISTEGSDVTPYRRLEPL